MVAARGVADAIGRPEVDDAGQRGAGAQRLLWRDVQLDARDVGAAQREGVCARPARRHDRCLTRHRPWRVALRHAPGLHRYKLAATHSARVLGTSSNNPRAQEAETTRPGCRKPPVYHIFTLCSCFMVTHTQRPSAENTASTAHSTAIVAQQAIRSKSTHFGRSFAASNTCRHSRSHRATVHCAARSW